MSLLGNPLVRTTFPVNYFAGDGTTTSFTLSEAATSVNAMEVFVNGAHIPPSAYSVSGTTLTFNTAPANAAQIVVRQLSVRGTVNVPASGTVSPTTLSTGHPSWDASGNFTVPGNLTVSGGQISGNATTANTLSIPRTINGVAFDGSQNISVSVTEAQVIDGTLLARVADNETITGSWTFNSPIVSVDPVSAAQLATKNYVDNIATGITWKAPARLATTTNIALSGLSTIDGKTPVAGDRILVKNQTTTSQNGVYLAAAGAWTRTTDFDAPNEVNGSALLVTEGTAQADTGWVQTAEVATVGTSALTFVQFQGAGTYQAGGGLSITGNTFNVGTASTARIVVNPGTIDLASVTDSGTGSFLKLAKDSYGRVTGTTAVVAADITGLVNNTYVAKAGDTMTGSLTNSSGFIGPLTGNADTATRLFNARTISITGDATWSTTFDGSGNASGVLTLSSVGTPVSSSFVKITTNAKGLVSATTPVVAGDITPLLNSTYVLKAGDSMTGALSITVPAANALQVLSGSSTSGSAIGLGRTTASDLQLAVAANAGDWTSGSIAGDGVIRVGASNNILFGRGGSTLSAVITSSGNFGVGVNPSVNRVQISTTGAQAGLVVGGNTTSAATQDLSAYRSGTASASVNQGANLLLGNSDAQTNFLLQEYQGGLQLFGYSGGWNERMRINSGGQVGIGRVSVSEKVEVGGALAVFGQLAGTTGSRFALDENAGAARLISSGANTTTLGTFNFYQQSSDNSLNGTALFIGSTGNIGIGTVSPTSKLTVAGGIDTVPASSLITSSVTTVQLASGAKLLAEYYIRAIGSNIDHKLVAMVNSDQYGIATISILSNVAYNGTTVIGNLRVVGSSNGDTRYLVVDTTTTAALNIYVSATGYITALAPSLTPGGTTAVTNNYPIYIDNGSGGSFVGIGGAPLNGHTFSVTTPNATIADFDSTFTNGGYLSFSKSGTLFGFIGNAGSLTASGTLNDLGIRFNNNLSISGSGGVERMKFDTAGNVSMGQTTGSGYSFGINSSGTGKSNIIINAAGSGTVQLFNNFSGSNDAYGMPTGTAGLATFPTSPEPLVFGTAGLERLRIDTVGNIGVGATPFAWSGAGKIIDGAVGSFRLGTGSTEVVANMYYNGSNWIYKSNGYGLDYTQNISSGQHQWFTWPTGVAGAIGTAPLAMNLDSLGNLGIGLTTQAWNTGYRAIEFKSTGGGYVFGGPTDVYTGTNSYYNSAAAWIRNTANPTTLYAQNTGNHIWYSDASGSAGGTFNPTNRMQLDVNGNLGVGAASGGMKVYITGPSATSIGIDSPVSTGYSSLRLGNGNTTEVASGVALHYFNNAYPSSGPYAATGSTLSCWGAGGIALNAENASGSIKFYNGTVKHATFTTAGAVISNAAIGYSFVSVNSSSTASYLICTLPASTLGTYDQATLLCNFNDNWGSGANRTAKIMFANRNAFTARFMTHEGAAVTPASRIQAYTQADGSTQIYAVLTNGYYGTLSVDVRTSIQVTLVPSPVAITTTPPGTLAFDTYTATPAIAVDASSNLTVLGNISGAGAGGFTATTYVANGRSPIFRFGNADAYGLSYFQGSAGVESRDTIGVHFGVATAVGSHFKFNSGADATTATSYFHAGTDQGLSTAGKIKSSVTSTTLPCFGAEALNGFATSIYSSRSPTAASTNWYHFNGQTGNGSSVTTNAIIIYGNGNIQNTNNSYGALSDERLKQDIVDASSQWADIKAIRVRKFHLKEDPTGPLQIGVIAQELEETSPGLVQTNVLPDETEETKSVKYSIMYMKAIKALQEAMTRIEALEADVAALKSK